MAKAIEERQHYYYIIIMEVRRRHTRGARCICARYCSRLLVW